jgi:enamine deaminase RidA (YjgF/YER057c/UK114 family)
MHTFNKLAALSLSILLTASLTAGMVQAEEIKRTINPSSTMPFATAVTVPAGAQIIYFSGALADVANADAPKDTFEAYGDTKTQVTSVLKKFEKMLAGEGLTMADVVKVNVFLVGDPKLDGKMDFVGLNAAYGQFFGTAAQPNKAARSTVQVAALARPGSLVEIEMTAARVAPPAK